MRFRTADGHQRSKQFKRKREADGHVSLVEVDRMSGALIDPRLGRITVGEWWDQWWPTVTNLRASTRARDAQFYKSHIRPVFADTPLGKLDRTSLRSWLARLGSPNGSDLAPATSSSSHQRATPFGQRCSDAGSGSLPSGAQASPH